MIINSIWRNIGIRLKLLIVLLMLLGLLASAFYLINLEFQHKNVEQLISSNVRISQASFKNQQDVDTRMLSSLLNVVIQDSAIKQRYLTKDREKLYAYIEPLFKNLDEKYNITHWYFILPDGTVFLRAHDKTLYGDVVARKTFLAARDTKQISSGLELGKTAYALRVVMPYYNNGKLIGYMELGEEINHFLTNLETESGNKFSIFVDKSRLSHVDWQSTRKKAGLADNWGEYLNQLPVSSTSDSELTKKCLVDKKISTKHLIIGNQIYACARFGLIAAGNQPSGTIVSLININNYALLIKESNSRIVIWVIVLMLVAFSVGLLIFLSIVNPIKRFAQVAKAIAAGDLTKRAIISSTDEIGQLAISFNEMVSKLQQSRQALEQKIQEKTKQLSQALKKSQEQNKILEKNKLVMINLLENSKALEEELEKEKKSVEKKIIERTNQLNSEKTKLSASISSLPIGFIMVDKSHKVLLVNKKAQETLGLTKDHIKIFDDILNLFPKDSAIFKIHENYHIDKNFVVQTGEVVFGSKMLKMSIVPITKKIDEEIEVLGSILLIDDITEEKVLERSKNEFFSIASHELRTPLTAIRGNTSMILDYYAKDLVNPDLITMITDTHSASVHLISIVNDFLDMSRLEQGKMEYKKEKVSPSEIVKKIMTALAVNALEKKIAILSTIDEKMVIWADYGKVEQVLFNLIGNALKFTDKGTITISAKSDKDNVQIEVSDTGHGIPLASQNLLFRKFQQAGSSTVTRDTTQGTGLGLYISRLMAEGMGGKLLLVKSIDGEGSVFSLTLPMGNKRLVLQ